jgi:hypothetical protein
MFDARGCRVLNSRMYGFLQSSADISYGISTRSACPNLSFLAALVSGFIVILYVQGSVLEEQYRELIR